MQETIDLTHTRYKLDLEQNFKLKKSIKTVHQARAACHIFVYLYITKALSIEIFTFILVDLIQK